MPRDRGAPRGVDVYLFPAVVGGGLGDIEEVLTAGRRLADAGFPVFLYRADRRPLPRSVDGPFEWPTHARIHQLHPRNPRALTLSAGWGIAAAPARDEPLGRAGPWAREAADIESRYGREATLHVSFEEFARTFTSRRQTVERFREAGRLSDVRAARRYRTLAEEERKFREAYRKFRAFDQPSVLHLFTTLRFSRAFAREYPEAVQTGPLWPRRPGRRGHSRRASGAKAAPPTEWIWYASPASAERLVRPIDRGLAGAGRPVRIRVRSPRPMRLPTATSVDWVEFPPSPEGTWRRAFAAADLRVVTGSRTLLEAIECGGPFLYYNGVLGRGSAQRRHRPEKIEALLAEWSRAHVSPRLRRDLADFARARRVGEIARTALTDPTWRRLFPRDWRPTGFSPPWDDAGELLVTLARGFAGSEESSPTFVRRLRSGELPKPSQP